jgi:branched-chain amino acid transport system ATP-binding protein
VHSTRGFVGGVAKHVRPHRPFSGHAARQTRVSAFGASMKIIEFDKVVAGYSPSLTILNETTLDARKGEITLLIGPNGAGKSTVLKTLFGMLVPRGGEIRFEGRRINGVPPRRLLAEGMAFVPQGRNLFGSLSVRHNLELGGITLPRRTLGDRIEEVLARFPRIRERIDNQASTMSGGEQKQLEVGRALLLHPRVLLIDEPSIGLSPKLVQEVMTLLRGLADAGTTILMVEQNVRTALKYSNRALVLEMGRLALDRPADALLGDPDLNRLFLGGHAKPAAAA